MTHRAAHSRPAIISSNISISNNTSSTTSSPFLPCFYYFLTDIPSIFGSLSVDVYLFMGPKGDTDSRVKGSL